MPTTNVYVGRVATVIDTKCPFYKTREPFFFKFEAGHTIDYKRRRERAKFSIDVSSEMIFRQYVKQIDCLLKPEALLKRLFNRHNYYSSCSYLFFSAMRLKKLYLQMTVDTQF